MLVKTKWTGDFSLKILHLDGPAAVAGGGGQWTVHCCWCWWRIWKQKTGSPSSILQRSYFCPHHQTLVKKVETGFEDRTNLSEESENISSTNSGKLLLKCSYVRSQNSDSVAVCLSCLELYWWCCDWELMFGCRVKLEQMNEAAWVLLHGFV